MLLTPVSLQVRNLKLSKILKTCLVGTVLYNSGPHDLVLDKIHNGKFVFKNTYVKDKQLEVAVDAIEAPEEFFFVHINYMK